MLSPRIAQQMIGLGLLEAIPAVDIIAGADPGDANGDGISGRAQIILSPEYFEPMLGRFGHKAGTATVYQQSSGAFHGDIGISSPLFPQGWGECTVAQVDCRGRTGWQQCCERGSGNSRRRDASGVILCRKPRGSSAARL